MTDFILPKKKKKKLLTSSDFSVLDQAHSAYHGIGLVKLMGRSSGFIAMHASLSSGQIDVCLIPEVCIIKDAFFLVIIIRG